MLTLLLLNIAVKSILIKQIEDDDLKQFLLYRSRMLISPYKSEEVLKSAPIENYMPVKIKLLGGAHVQLKKIELESD